MKKLSNIENLFMSQPNISGIKGDDKSLGNKIRENLEFRIEKYSKPLVLTDMQKKAIKDYVCSSKKPPKITEAEWNEIFDNIRIDHEHPIKGEPLLKEEDVVYSLIPRTLRNKTKTIDSTNKLFYVMFDKQESIKQILSMKVNKAEKMIDTSILYMKRKNEEFVGNIRYIYQKIIFLRHPDIYIYNNNKLFNKLFDSDDLFDKLFDSEGKTRVVLKEGCEIYNSRCSISYYDKNGCLEMKKTIPLSNVTVKKKKEGKTTKITDTEDSEIISIPSLHARLKAHNGNLADITSKPAYYFSVSSKKDSTLKKYTPYSPEKAKNIAYIILADESLEEQLEYREELYGEKNHVSLIYNKDIAEEKNKDVVEKKINKKKADKIKKLLNNPEKKEVVVVLILHGNNSRDRDIKENGEVKIVLDFIAKNMRENQHIYIKNKSCFASNKIKGADGEKIDLLNTIEDNFKGKKIFYSESATNKLPVSPVSLMDKYTIISIPPNKRYMSDKDGKLKVIDVKELKEEDWEKYGKEDQKPFFANQRVYLPALTAKECAITEAQKRIEQAERKKLINENTNQLSSGKNPRRKSSGCGCYG